jgi:UDP-N-acetylglucosamine 2-epimerase (non-hydrolysing)
MSKPIFVIVGTRPDAIKLAPVCQALKEVGLEFILCSTFQHNELTRQVLDCFSLRPDLDLMVMKENQNLSYATTAILEKVGLALEKFKPELVLVQGDTVTAFASALAAFYRKIDVGHIEAGLRSGDFLAPFPEEFNRVAISKIAKYHFAPTSLNVANLLSEGISKNNIICTGNTVVSSVMWMKEKIKNGSIFPTKEVSEIVCDCKLNGKKIVLFTAHRRESFGQGLSNIFDAVRNFASEKKDVHFVFPVHPNPNVLSAVNSSGIKGLNNIHLCQPLLYKDLIYVLMASSWVVTDSGGIQEEAISLGKRVLVLRKVTERMEGVWYGGAYLSGLSRKSIQLFLNKLYLASYGEFEFKDIYGDGSAHKNIAAFIKSNVCKDSRNKAVSLF